MGGIWALTLVLNGCASIRVDAGGQAVRVERHWGVLAVTIDHASKSQVADMTALGLVSSPMGWSAGYSRQRWAALGADCRVVIWVTNSEALSSARQFANSKPGICLIGSTAFVPMEDGVDETKY